jgi:hypothetical protein
VPALQPYIIEPIWEQFCALPPERMSDHPLGCHRPRIPDRVVFEKLAIWERAGRQCEWTEDGQRCTATFPNPRDANAV